MLPTILSTFNKSVTRYQYGPQSLVFWWIFMIHLADIDDTFMTITILPPLAWIEYYIKINTITLKKMEYSIHASRGNPVIKTILENSELNANERRIIDKLHEKFINRILNCKFHIRLIH